MIRKAFLLLPAALLAFSFTSASAQTDTPQTPFFRFLSHFDLGVSGAGMFTGDATGPIVSGLGAPNQGTTVTQQTSNTLGAIVNIRYVQKPYIGFEFNGTYARYTEEFKSAAPYQVQTRADEYTLGYLITPPLTIGGLRPYASAGVGTTEFRPTAHGGQGQLPQGRLTYYYSAGLQKDLNDTFGLRVGVRQAFFMDPDFFANYLTLNKRTSSFEPTAGFYIRF
ncbi:MAG: outer membrane beta-barrel protein [Acidobacteriota bacterium]